MWVVFLIIWTIFGSGTAAAFECVGVKLPSTIVICSDRELMRLADERQEAINEARGRIGEDAWPPLWEDQKDWVRSYATACGVPLDRPPPTPVPASERRVSNEPPRRALPTFGLTDPPQRVLPSRGRLQPSPATVSGQVLIAVKQWRPLRS